MLMVSGDGGSGGAGRGERGSALPLVAGILAVTVAVAMGLVALGGWAVDRARAQAAADSAALAGVVQGRDAAAELAERNGGRLVSFEEVEEAVVVEVRVGTASARAAATVADELDGGVPFGS